MEHIYGSPFLPNLTDEPTLNIPDTGKWNSNNKLDQLVNSLKATTDDTTEITSIPDVFARPKLFSDVLSNEQHSLYQRYAEQWRGLITIMALRSVRSADKNIKVHPIYVPRRAQDTNNEFLKVLAKAPLGDYIKLQGDKTFNEEEYRTVIYVVTYDDNPFAIAWPTVLITPAAEVDILLPEDKTKFPWWKQNGFGDPIPHLNNDEKADLITWLTELSKIITNDVASLATLVLKYVQDLKESLGEDYNSDNRIKYDDEKKVMTGFVDYVDKPIVRIIINSEASSDLELNIQTNNKSKRIILLSKDIARQWGNPNDISLIGPIMLGNVINECFEKGKLKSRHMVGKTDLNKFNMELRLADEFFTDVLGVVSFKDAFANTYNNGVYRINNQEYSIIYPIKRELLEYLPAKYLASNIKVESINSTDLKVTLSLPIISKGTEEKRLKVSKIYHYDDGMSADEVNTEYGEIIEFLDTPAMQLWPNFVVDNWQAYYTYYDPCGNFGFKLEPGWPEEEIEKREIQIDNEFTGEICKGRTYPEYMVCTTIPNGIDTTTKIDLGVILLNKSKAPTSEGGIDGYRIGIDFGTTNTVGYMRVDTANANEGSLIRIKNRMLDICYSGRKSLSAMAKRNLRWNFLSTVDQPNGENNISIRTMFHNYNAITNNNKSPLFKGNIYYLDNYDNITLDQKILKSIHHSDLKWSDFKGGENTASFLKQLCMQYMAEVAIKGTKEITWYFSHPGSFTGSQKSRYMSVWDDHLYDVLQSIFPVNKKKAIFTTESRCVFKYFDNIMQAKLKYGMVGIDMGGGTTDIAIRQGNDIADGLRHQISIRLAGKDILNKYLFEQQKSARNYPLLAIKSADDNEYNEQIDAINKAMDKNEFDMHLEAFLKYYEKDIILGLNKGSFSEEGAKFVSDIAFAFSGIFYYVGYVVGCLRKMDICEEKRVLPSIYIGGNASKLLDWAAKGSYNDDKQVAVIFKKCFLMGVIKGEGLKPDNLIFELEKTSTPKEEVAAGLMSVREEPDAEIKKESDSVLDELMSMQSIPGVEIKAVELSDELIKGDGICFAGELFTYTNRSKEVKSELLRAKDIREGIELKGDKPEMFAEFVNIFNHLAKTVEYSQVYFSDKDYWDMYCSINDNLDKQIGMDEDKIYVEPLFITVLKSAMDIIATR